MGKITFARIRERAYGECARTLRWRCLVRLPVALEWGCSMAHAKILALTDAQLLVGVAVLATWLGPEGTIEPLESVLARIHRTWTGRPPAAHLNGGARPGRQVRRDRPLGL